MLQQPPDDGHAGFHFGGGQPEGLPQAAQQEFDPADEPGGLQAMGPRFPGLGAAGGQIEKVDVIAPQQLGDLLDLLRQRRFRRVLDQRALHRPLHAHGGLLHLAPKHGGLHHQFPLPGFHPAGVIHQAMADHHGGVGLQVAFLGIMGPGGLPEGGKGHTPFVVRRGDPPAGGLACRAQDK